MPRRKGISDSQKSQLDRISESLARLSKEVKTTEHTEVLEDIVSDLEHVTGQLQDVSSFGLNVPARRSAPKPKPAPASPPPPAAAAANIPPAPVRATATVAPKGAISN